MKRIKKLSDVITLLLLLLLIFVLDGCYTLQTANKQLLHAQIKYPNVISNICSNLYPPMEKESKTIEYLKGDVLYQHDTLQIDCDTVQNHIVKKVTSKPILRVDTIKTREEIQIESTSKLASLQYKYDSAISYLNEQINIKQDTINNYNAMYEKERAYKKIWQYISLILLGYLSIKNVLRYFIPFFSKLP